MRKILFVFAALALTVTAMAQSEKYTGAMTAKIEELGANKTADDFLASSQAFERIADTEKNQWLPYYYAAYAYGIYAFVKNDAANNDQYADKIDTLLAKASALAPDNTEISVIKSISATVRMIVNPMERYMQYGPVIEKALSDAKTQDPNNPRPYFIQGQNLRYTPEQFGGGCATAKPIMEEALKKYGSFKPASTLHPNWGQKQLEEMIAGCK